jgi:hypothetical protein
MKFGPANICLCVCGFVELIEDARAVRMKKAINFETKEAMISSRWKMMEIKMKFTHSYFGRITVERI